MSVVKFQTTVENGNILIPKQFRNQIKGHIEVIVKTEEDSVENDEKNFLREMTENPIKDSNFVPLTRDEIYDREADRAENFINFLMKNPLKVDKSVPFLKRNEIYDRKL
ncbi:hypothetical protein BH20ACI1_BH20ACI1_18210 [soil metagenome]